MAIGVANKIFIRNRVLRSCYRQMTATDVRLPVLRNDEDTVRERMTDNAWNNVLPARYLSDGESQGDVWERIGKNVALGDLPHFDADLQFQSKHVKPDHPRRDELLEEAFGYDPAQVPVTATESITEDTAVYLSYDAIIRDLPSGVQDRLEETKQKFTDVMEHLNFVPNSPTIMNAGDELQQLSACFVNSPDDDMEDIHETVKGSALIFQSGGGVGYAFSKLRPEGDPVGSTGGVASGPITFMRTFDQTCGTVAQGGARRGAQMGVMDVRHPDIVEFIHAKDKDVSLAHTLRLNDPDDFRHNSFAEALEESRGVLDEYGGVPDHLRNAVEGHLSNFNISVGVTDDFMDAIENEEEYTLINPRTDEPHIATRETADKWGLYGYDVEEGDKLSIRADKLYEDICEGAHENGEPGMIMLERINNQHSFDVDEYPEHEIYATNPCGEQALERYEACNLGHINLSTLVQPESDRPETLPDDPVEQVWQTLDMDELERRIDLGVQFLDNVVTMSNFPQEEITEKVGQNRKVGLGIMGLAQMFVQVGIEYGTEQAADYSEAMMRIINRRSKARSHELALERGSFGNWNESKYSQPTEYPEWFSNHVDRNPADFEDGYEIRNHNTLTIAPTGTTSMLGNTSGGCEPIYDVARYKNVSGDVQGDEMLVEFDELFLSVLRANEIPVDEIKAEAQEMMQNNEYTGPADLSIPADMADLFVTTSDLSAIQHGRMQTALQTWIDSSISKTVNAPNSDTLEDAKDAFRYVYDNGGKGITYYRDGTRSKQVLTTRQDNQDVGEEDLETLAEEYEPTELLAEAYGLDDDEAIETVDSVLESREADSTSPDKAAQASESGPRETGTEPRPGELNGTTHRVQTGYGMLYVTVNSKDGRPFEVIATVGKSGGLVESMTEAIAREASMILRAGVSVTEVIEQLENIKSPEIGWHEGTQIHSVPDGIAHALKKEQPASTEEPEVTATPKNLKSDGGDVVDGTAAIDCPSCGSSRVVKQEGCKTCHDCGWSKC